MSVATPLPSDFALQSSPGPGPAVRALVVEDSAVDAELVVRELSRQGYSVDWFRVADGSGLAAALEHGSWDLVLSDYAMPGFGGLEALRIVRSAGRDLPFLLVSGTIGEDAAVEAMKAGAHDYLLKDRLARLGAAVTRELREAAVRRARHEAEESARKAEAETLRLLAEAEASRRTLLSMVEDQRRTEAELRLRTSALDAAANAVVITDREGAIVWFNPAFATLTGYTAAECLGRNPRDLVRSGKHEPAFYQEMWETILAGKVWRGTIVNRRKDRSLFTEEATITPVRDAAGVISHFIAIKEDITERQRTEERLREQAALLDAASDAIHVSDLAGALRYWNQGAARLYEWSSEEAEGRTVPEVLGCDAGSFAAAHARVVQTGAWSGELATRSRSGRDIVVDCRWTLLPDAAGRPREVLAINTDLTEKKRLEAQFLRAQRLESIGALASGIAHDLNNVLTPILMTAPLLRASSEDPENHALLDTVETCAERGAAIIRQLLTFARGAPSARVPIPIRHLVRDMEKLVRETFPRDIELRSSFPKEQWPVLGDATQLHQALLNLCVNARDAMPDGGQLTLSTRNVVVDEANAAATPDARPGPHVCVAVTDTGMGIAADQMHRIFEPFYTTKEPGKGTGLGLATVLGIARGHGGFVRVESQLGKGSTFEVYLPASPQAPAAPPRVVDPESVRGHGEWILLVDDEPSLRTTLKMLLERHGYQVVAASNGPEALDEFARRRGEIRAVVTDMMMPVMNGPALVKAFLAVDPALPIIGMTGLPDRAGLKGLGDLELAVLLVKPFAGADLLQGLRQVLTDAG